MSYSKESEQFEAQRVIVQTETQRKGISVQVDKSIYVKSKDEKEALKQLKKIIKLSK
jgi:translation initiation factor 1 (eIF-1/SUI1)